MLMCVSLQNYRYDLKKIIHLAPTGVRYFFENPSFESDEQFVSNSKFY